MTRTASAVPAGWREDPENGDLMRWWDGSTWAESRQSRAVYVAERQYEVMAKMARDISTLRQIAVTYVMLSLIGAIAFYIAVSDKS